MRYALRRNYFARLVSVNYQLVCRGHRGTRLQRVQSWEDESIEIRDYESRILAVTDMSEGSISGFRVLAGYIFGGNEREQEIAMTAPVRSTMPNKNEAEMAFVVPSEFDLEDLPTPNDARVGFREEPAYRAAVIRFSGWMSDKKAERHWQKLRQFLVEQGINRWVSPHSTNTTHLGRPFYAA